MNHNFNKTVNLDVLLYKDSLLILTALFKYQARKENWTEQEITTVISEANRLKDHSHFIVTINDHCEVKTDTDINEVWEVVSQLGLYTHYLVNKAIADWDAYDKSNYRSLLLKSGRLKKLYGVYDAMIPQELVETTTRHPNFFFKTFEEAEVVMQEMIADNLFEADEVHVLFHYQKQ